jgi:5-methylcytosine-specific restriction endonuclease McrA
MFTLTDAIVRAATPPASGQGYIRDKQLRGFGLRVLPSGIRSFIFEAKIGGRFVPRTLGQYPIMTVAVARQEALRLKAEVAAVRLDAKKAALKHSHFGKVTLDPKTAAVAPGPPVVNIYNKARGLAVEHRLAANGQDLQIHIASARKPISKRLRFLILERDKFRCVYCGWGAAEGAKLQVDHVKAVANGGTNDGNLVTSFGDCNFGKGARELAAGALVVAAPGAQMDLLNAGAEGQV